ncbi:MAG: glycosyltransferase family 2 protein [Anaerolineae bacterium]|nr:MAG: glycosyltransferase family 2 protein [Anaerolineae bacterium]
MAIATLLTAIYFLLVAGLALYGFNALFLSALFLRHRRRRVKVPELDEWPGVTVQLPLFNERFVVERLIDSVASLDYPRTRLSIQVLDDSTDETGALAQARVAHYQTRGVNIAYLRRKERTGFKAGALAYGLTRAPGDFIAVFDADFCPPPDFLQRVMPHFNDPRVGMVQARWGHLNAEYSVLTRAQALALDGHFVVEQTARSRANLLLNFNGSAGVWRRECIADAGGWQADTVAEDLDLSYRAQIAGWQLRYLPDVVAPAEVPPFLTAFKRQQFRWAKGSIQCLRKLGGHLLRSSLSPWRKVQGLLHVGGYLIHPLMLAMVLIGLPLICVRNPGSLPLSALGVAGFAPPVVFALSQWATYPDWRQRFAYFPILVLLGAGVALNNTWAVWEALAGRNPSLFLRTPKFRSEGQDSGRVGQAGTYNLPVDWTTWGELALALYCLVEAIVAVSRAPGLAPFLITYAMGYAYTAGLGLWQSWQTPRPRAMRSGAGAW